MFPEVCLADFIVPLCLKHLQRPAALEDFRQAFIIAINFEEFYLHFYYYLLLLYMLINYIIILIATQEILAPGRNLYFLH